jgi:multidrug transporter EmrE-like cation transporter
MRLTTFSLILCSVLMSAGAQVLLKMGMSDARVADAIASNRRLKLFFEVFSNRWVVLGLALYILGAVIWLAVLSRVEVSLAYPFVGIGFVAIMLLGWLLLGDSINAQRVVGTVLITAGVVLIARGG